MTTRRWGFIAIIHLVQLVGVHSAQFLFSTDTLVVGTASYERIGSRIAVSENLLVVGNQSQTRVYERHAGGPNQWGQIRLIDAAGAVAAQNDLFVVGGTAYSRNEGGPGNWGVVVSLPGPGRVLGLDGDTLVMAEPGYDLNPLIQNVGRILIYTRDQLGQWQTIATKRGTWQNGSLGYDGAFQDDTIVAFQRDTGGFSTFFYYEIYQRNHGGANVWGRVALLEQPNNISRVDVDSNRLIMANVGLGQIYAGNPPSWTVTSVLTNSAPGYGSSIALDGNRLFVGVPGRNEVQVLDGLSNWAHVETIDHSSSNTDDSYGGSISRSGNLLAVGAYFFEPSSLFTNTGAAYVHRILDEPPPIYISRSEAGPVLSWPPLDPPALVALEESSLLSPATWADHADRHTNPRVLTPAAGTRYFRLRLLPPPIITLQPRSGIFPQGDSASLRVVANGNEPLSYQWQLNQVDISGASDATLQITDIQPAEEGNYRVLISGANGGQIYSDEVFVEVIALVINVHPQSVTVQERGDALFTVEAEGFNLSYQWQKDGADIGGPPRAELEVSNVRERDEGVYRVVVRAGNGVQIISNEATLTIVP